MSDYIDELGAEMRRIAAEHAKEAVARIKYKRFVDGAIELLDADMRLVFVANAEQFTDLCKHIEAVS